MEVLIAEAKINTNVDNFFIDFTYKIVKKLTKWWTHFLEYIDFCRLYIEFTKKCSRLHKSYNGNLPLKLHFLKMFTPV